MSSLETLATIQKNGVVAINNLATYVLGLYNNVATTRLAETALTASLVTLYTAPSSTNAHVNSINICNTTGSQVSVSIYIVPSGSTASTSNALLYNLAIPGYTTVLWESVQIIPTGGTLQAQASTTGCTVNISGGAST